MGILRKLRSRSASEIRFRLRQEAVNFRLYAFPPQLPETVVEQIAAPFPSLPRPADVAGGLAGSPFAAQCLQQAELILQHRFPLLGITLDTGPDIRWRRDYASGAETGAFYFRRIPYLDAARAGDHKSIWEINRHQHLVLLAQAHLFACRDSGRQDFLAELVRQLETWFEQNSFQRGINWTSALEVGFRALSWIWIYHLVGDRFEPAFRRRFIQELYRHGLHLEVNLSYYFSPNTHLLGEAVALHALGRLLPQLPPAKRWEETGARVVRNELDRQVLADGCHFERSTYYHVYALDMFVFHAVLRGLDETYRAKLTLMAAFLDSVLGASGVLQYFGDDDGGRFFHPYGIRNQFGLATLATCSRFLERPEWLRRERDLEEQAAWWLGALPTSDPVIHTRAPASMPFAASGLVVMAAGGIHLIADAGPFGPGGGGHSHADTLSLVLRQDDEQILLDPGTYTYVGDPLWRERFRGTAAHNTVRIDGLDQAIPGGPFSWQAKPEVEVSGWETSPSRDVLTAVCRYRDVRHERTIVFHKTELWVTVEDRLEAGPGEHRIEQFWHFGAPVRQCPDGFRVGSKALVVFDASATAQLSDGGDYGWTSPAFGAKSPSPVVCVAKSGPSPAMLVTRIYTGYY